MILSAILLYEYRYFRQQARRAVELQDEYRMYITAVKKIVDEYGNQKEDDQEGTESESQKKKELIEQNELNLVNRDIGYLKKSALEFIKTQDETRILQRVNWNDLQDYNDQLISKQRSAPIKKVTKRQPRRAHKKTPAKRITKHEKQDVQFGWPIKMSEFWLSSFFGPRKKPNGTWGFHHGVDMAAMKGTPVHAAQDGQVIEAGFGKGFGKTIVISHTHKYKTRYAHLNEMLVVAGQKVKQGQLIGRVGNTGSVRSKPGRDASHLHFEVYLFGKAVNPMPYLS